MSDDDVPHFAFPFRFRGGRAVTLQQDTLDEIEQGVKVLVSTEKGERLEVPDFGIDDLAFRVGSTDMTRIAAEAADWDERSVVLFSDDRSGTTESMVRRILVSVKEAS